MNFGQQMQEAKNPHLAIEALRAMLTADSARVSRHNLVCQRAFSERLTELINEYTNQPLTSVEVISELIAMAREVAAEEERGKQFDPPLSEDEYAFTTPSRRTSRPSGSRGRACWRKSRVSWCRCCGPTLRPTGRCVTKFGRSCGHPSSGCWCCTDTLLTRRLRMVIEQMEEMAPRCSRGEAA